MSNMCDEQQAEFSGQMESDIEFVAEIKKPKSILRSFSVRRKRAGRSVPVESHALAIVGSQLNNGSERIPYMFTPLQKREERLRTELSQTTNIPVARRLQPEEITGPSTSVALSLSEPPELTQDKWNEANSMFSTQPADAGHVPYYFKYFSSVVNSCLTDEWHSHLIDENDRELMTRFCSLSDSAAKLYVRLFLRKPRWLKCSSLKYPDLGCDLSPYVTELIKLKFIETGSTLKDVDEMLNLMDAGSIKTVARVFKVKPNQAMAKLKTRLKECSKTQRTLKGTFENALLDRCRKECSEFCHVTPNVYYRFVQLVVMAAPLDIHVVHLERSPRSNLFQLYLYKLLQVEQGLLAFPPYAISRCEPIFKTRGYLNDYVKFLLLHIDVAEATDKKAHTVVADLLKDTEYFAETEHEKCVEKCELPFARMFSMTTLRSSLAWCHIEALQKLKRHEEACMLLEKALDCSAHGSLQVSRGRLWERYSLNLDVHMKEKQRALDVVKTALEDEKVAPHHRVSLVARQKRLERYLSKRSGKKKRMSAETEDNVEDSLSVFDATFDPLLALELEVGSPELIDAPTRTITGETMSKELGDGRSVRFLSKDGEQDGFSVSSVEKVAARYYVEKLGYEQAVHGEGAIPRTIAGLLFHDVVYSDVPDAFHFEYQDEPLDLRVPGRGGFYDRRRSAIEERLEMLKSGDWERISTLLQDTWSKHKGQICSLISWDLFESCSRVEGLMKAFEPRFLAWLCSYILDDVRNRTGGFPDLIVWTPERKFKMVEVKGPGDKLSNKQRLWLDALLSNGGFAEVCYVEARKTKKL